MEQRHWVSPTACTEIDPQPALPFGGRRTGIGQPLDSTEIRSKRHIAQILGYSQNQSCAFDPLTEGPINLVVRVRFHTQITERFIS
jgi:hypothetical protein